MLPRVIAQEFSPQAWEPFGWAPVRDTDPEDGERRLAFAWADAHVNLICHRLDELQRTTDGFVCDVMFRHATHTQALMVLNTAAVVAAAPASCQLGGPADLGLVRAFLLRPHDSFVLHRGTWHWGPFPTDAPQVDLFNVQGLRYREDNDCAPLAELGAAFEVVTGTAGAKA
jgi:ureidoglycolate hydrolase